MSDLTPDEALRIAEQLERWGQHAGDVELYRRAARAIRNLVATSDSTMIALRTESARLDWLLGGYTARRALLDSGVLDLLIVQRDGARAAIDASQAAPAADHVWVECEAAGECPTGDSLRCHHAYCTGLPRSAHRAPSGVAAVKEKA